MDYTIEINNKTLELPPYTLAVIEKIEKVEKNTNSPSATLKNKVKAMYDFVVEFVGKEETEEAIGIMQEVDINTLNIAYLSILRAYTKPLEDFEMEQHNDSIRALNDTEMAKLGETLSKFENIANQIQTQGKKFHK